MSLSARQDKNAGGDARAFMSGLEVTGRADGMGVFMWYILLFFRNRLFPFQERRV